MTNREIAQEISSRIGNSPVPFDSVYSIALQIYNELGGEETQFDSVYSILLEILPLVEGGGGKAIEEVDELPEASENKDKFYRVEGEDGIYAAKLLSSETITTNKLPDEQQIDKAYLFESENDRYYYNGAYKIICSDGELNWYFWRYDDTGAFMGYATEDNAVLANADTNGVWVDEGDDNWIEVTNTYARTEYTIDELMNGGGDVLGGFGVTPIPAIYNAPESSQIGNAYLIDAANEYKGVYDGTQVTFIDTDGEGEEVTGYKWTIEGNDEQYLTTSKPASDIYFQKGSFIDDEQQTLYYYSTDITVWVVAADGTESERSGISQQHEDSIYIPQLNAPDSEQVGNAYIVSDFIGYETTFTYNGSCILHLSDTDLTAYKWTTEDDSNVVLVSIVPASDVYSLNTKIWYFITTNDNEWVGNESTLKDSTEYTGEYISQSYFEDYIFVGNEMLSFCETDKYQREETIEEWGWENIVKPVIIDVESLPDEVTDANKGNIYRLESDDNYMAVNSEEYGLQWEPIATQEFVNQTVCYFAPMINGAAELTYNQDGTINGIDNVSLDTPYGYDDWKQATHINVKMDFSLKMSGMDVGSVSATGIMTKYTLTFGGSTVTNYRFTFPFMDISGMQAATQDTLQLDYNDDDETWTAKLLFASQNQSAVS
jgi:hypothetical protein